MAMNGIGQFDPYNSYKLNIEEQDARRIESYRNNKPETEKAVPEAKPEQKISLSLNIEGIKAKSNMSISDVSLSMMKPSSSSFDMKALSFDNNDDEMDKAISDVEKDSALMQYSYFVGDSNVVMEDEDGIVLRKSPVE